MNTWHTVKLGFSGNRITASLDGAALGTVTDAAFTAGLVGVGVVGYQTNLFDNVSVTPNADGNFGGILKGQESGLCADVPAASQVDGTAVALWDCTGGANQSWTATPAKQLMVYGTKCLATRAGGTANGTPVQIDGCDNTAAQQWTVNADGSAVNSGSGRCLDAAGHGTANGTALVLWDCNEGANQKWARGDTVGILKSQESGKCADVPGASQANGTVPALWGCNNGSNQAWTSTTTNQLKVFDTKCLETADGGTADGTAVQIHDCAGAATQQWRVQSGGAVVNVGSGKCLDVKGHGTADGTPFVIWPCDGAANQRWARS
ncbi:RICIN domain-containing protein [Amycolatopsis sp. NPDC051045]|uniref:RICIN domain-containing protein n=1 Tax=Amycolatopsis sp. NPDC051045 TaxID=3156922 RepID=UPI0034469CA7